MLLDQCLQIKPVKIEVTVPDFKTFLRKVERLLHQIGVRIILLIQLLRI